MFIVSHPLSAQVVGNSGKSVIIRDTVIVRPTIFTPQFTLEGWFVKPYINGHLFLGGGDPLSVDTAQYGESIALKAELRYGTYTDVWGSAAAVSQPNTNQSLSQSEATTASASGGIFVTVLTDGEDTKSVPPRYRTPLDAERGVFVRADGDTIKPADGMLQIEVASDEIFYYIPNGVPPEAATANVQIDICYPDAITGCGSFVATVVIKGDGCPKLERNFEQGEIVTRVTDDMFEVVELNNNAGCNEPSKPGHFTAGATFFDHADFGTTVKNTYPGITTLKIPITWGVCTQTILAQNSNIKFVDVDENENVTNINTIGEAQNAISDFSKSLAEGGFNVNFGSLDYYPLLKTKIHEQIHVYQYKQYLKSFIDDALNTINSMPPPPDDWCKEDKLESILKDRGEKVKQYMNQAIKDCGDFINSQNLEDGPNLGGHLGAKLTIKKIKEKFGI